MDDRFFVSPWCDNGPVMLYLARYPNANRLELVRIRHSDTLDSATYSSVHRFHNLLVVWITYTEGRTQWFMVI